MPRGRHRHSPPLHRLLPPSAIAGVSLVCALGPWVFTQPMVLRLLAAAAAVTAVTGAVVMRHWDTQAGKRVADLTRARASDEWRFEERVAELEADLEESRELRMKLEQRLRAKRAELAGLRNEHAALLRRYATAEADRASVLEERRVLEIEATTPARALPAGASGASGPQALEPASVPGARTDGGAAAGRIAGEAARGGTAGASPEAVPAADATAGTVDGEPEAPKVFSPEGSQLFLRADAALVRLAGAPEADAPAGGGAAPAGEAAPQGNDAPQSDAPQSEVPENDTAPNDAVKGAPASEGGGAPEDDGPGPARRRKPEQSPEDEAQGQPTAVAGHEGAAASPAPAPASSPDAPAQPVPPGQPSARSTQPQRQPSGHFTVPTAVAVVPPTAPVRRPAPDDGFDFFGTKKSTERAALEAVQNEDLADVVGQEALALHKAEAEARFKAADEDARAVGGQVIDLTAHDETEQIDVQGLRSAVS
ncbi:hypothetical protein ACFYOV_07455 [Streptomyces sp. NPDC005931]|uniref:hypothetical protein n=1 Tax=Streptomyces sp. NPDC005931 TaxID=3364737 RepID=UPI0036B7A345